ncbi:MAG: hypothetical protein HFF80_05185 [Oscillospiraceae bacterium]|jgi:hypothetical protein|nr:hypothetical protein [Oscillospiraceae bacterium]
MQAIEIARRMAELGNMEDARNAWFLALQEGGLPPEDELEAAVCLLQFGGNYQAAYTTFLSLYKRGCFCEECLGIMTTAFYEPNIKELRGRYERNVKLLKKYPYLFRKDFPDFDELPVRLYPYGEESYIPFFVNQGEFGELADIKKPVISRNFFEDLEKPILAADVYSQYELEYLRDNVRRSEDVARENHVYLHYTDWGTFCSWLQCLNLRPLLREEKLVFLIGEEVSQYPIDFKERFGIDYSQYTLKPVGLREIHRMIWLSQLSSHNGINFFGEIFDGHPNLITLPAVSLQETMDTLTEFQGVLKECANVAQACAKLSSIPPYLVRELYLTPDPTGKNLLLAALMADSNYTTGLDPAARIAPALVFQPHFGNITYKLEVDDQDQTTISSESYEKIRTNPIFRVFKYIKTAAPLRLPTTSYAACVKYMRDKVDAGLKDDKGVYTVLIDEITRRILTRNYLIDWQDRLFQDSVLVRFEDAKMNPKATFTALAAFLDIPYTESLTYCSKAGERDPETLAGQARGFDLRAIYETYEAYANDAERAYIEFAMRDAYAAYGYDFRYYDGSPLDETGMERLVKRFDTIDRHIRESWERSLGNTLFEMEYNGARLVTSKEEIGDKLEKSTQQELSIAHENRLRIAKLLLRDLHFVNKNGQPLRMMPLLKLDPALLEQPLYH